MIMRYPIYIIVAVDGKNGIGRRGRLPWKLKKEIKYFAATTTKTADPSKQNMVIMGRTTWESLGPKYQPLKNRKNVILTSQKDFKAKGAFIANSLDEALKFTDNKTETIFIIGGAKVFDQAINLPALKGIYLTKIHHNYDCDTYLPKIPSRFSKIKKLGSQEENGIQFEYLFYSEFLANSSSIIFAK